MDEAMDISSDATEAAELQANEAEPHAPNTVMDTSPVFERRVIRSGPRVPRNLASSSGWLSTLQFQVSPSVSEAPSSSTLDVSLYSPQLPNEQPQAADSPPPIQVTQLLTIHRPAVIDLASPERADEASSENSPVTGEDISDGDSNDNTIGDLPTQEVTDMPSTSHMHERTVEFSGDTVEEPPSEHPQGVNSELFNAEAPQLEQNSPHILRTDPTIPIPNSDQQNMISPDVENVPLAQRIRSPDPLPLKSPPPSKKAKQDPICAGGDSDGEDEGNLCPICFDVWTNSGDHRLTSLRCGHLFGQHCIQHWLQIHKANDRRCPQCKKKASLKDLRQLYACKIKVLDTSEQEALKITIKKLEEEKERLTRELAYERQLNQEAMKIQQEQQLKLLQLQSHSFIPQAPQSLKSSNTSQSNLAQIQIDLLHRVEISRDGGCRVLAFNEWKEVLVASQFSPNLFAPYGVRLIDTSEFRPHQFIPMHTKAIRDLAFNSLRKDLLLSVSLDRSAKIFCMSSNAPIMSVNTETPLWSCCWDGDNSNVFFAGSHNGIVFQYDVRNTHTEVNRLTTQGDAAPVISLASVPAGDWLPRGGFFSCRLNRLRLYERINSAEFSCTPIEVDGPFSALDYSHKTKCMLLSTRPTTQSPHTQHQLYQMTYSSNKPQYQRIHSLMGSTTQRLMSRPCQLNGVGKGKHSLICAYQESEAYVAVWSAATGNKIPSGTLQCTEPIMDLCSVSFADRHLLASLSEKNLKVYQFS